MCEAGKAAPIDIKRKLEGRACVVSFRRIILGNADFKVLFKETENRHFQYFSGETVNTAFAKHKTRLPTAALFSLSKKSGIYRTFLRRSGIIRGGEKDA